MARTAPHPSWRWPGRAPGRARLVVAPPRALHAAHDAQTFARRRAWPLALRASRIARTASRRAAAAPVRGQGARHGSRFHHGRQLTAAAPYTFRHRPRDRRLLTRVLREQPGEQVRACWRPWLAPRLTTVAGSSRAASRLSRIALTTAGPPRLRRPRMSPQSSPRRTSTSAPRSQGTPGPVPAVTRHRPAAPRRWRQRFLFRPPVFSDRRRGCRIPRYPTDRRSCGNAGISGAAAATDAAAGGTPGSGPPGHQRRRGRVRSSQNPHQGGFPPCRSGH